MFGSLPRPFWIAFALTVVSAGSLALTIVWPQWLEIFFALDPDGGDGASEWALTLGLLAAAIASSALAGREWGKAQHSVHS